MGILRHDQVEQDLELLLAAQSAMTRFIRFIGFGKTGEFVNDLFHKYCGDREVLGRAKDTKPRRALPAVPATQGRCVAGVLECWSIGAEAGNRGELRVQSEE
jgi:hypothetical protein